MAEEPASPTPEEKPADAAPPAGSPSEATQAVPADALAKTNEELAEEGVDVAPGSDTPTTPDGKPIKKPGGIKALFKKINVYLLGFVIVAVVVAATGVVSYLNNKKVPKTPDVATQQLTTDALKQLANSDATVGSAAQTLTVQGNAIISGQLLVRKDLNVAGSIKLGGDFTAQNITASGKANFGDTQINSLQVAQNAALQGTTTVKDLNVAGTTSFGGPVTAAQLTVSKLILSGNGVLQIPNHLSFSGPSPTRSITDAGTLGAGGTVSINGSDTAGTININTGSGPVAGCFVKITFSLAFTTMPHIIASPFGAGTGSLDWYVTKSTTGFSICTLNAAPAGQVMGFDYFVTN